MNPQLERLKSNANTYISLAALLTAVLGSVSGLIEEFIKFLRSVLPVGWLPDPLPPQATWIVVGVCVLLGVFTFIQALAKRSELKTKERFLISPRDPAHLVGREMDLHRLAVECSNDSTALVFLTGESGAGKSALVQAGLVEYLNGNPYWTQPPKNLGAPPSLLPIRLDGAAMDDWAQGIEKALRRALSTHTVACTVRGIPAFVSTQSPFDWLRSVPETSCYRVVLIIDQMDDYIAMHRDRLFSEGKVLPAHTVEQANLHWHALAELVRSRAICLLLICRADASTYL